MYTHIALREFTEKVLLKMGYSAEQAASGADVLISADLRGIDSHGVIRLKDYYQLWKAGRVNASPEIKTVYETPSTAVVDADRALGVVAGPVAMQVAIEKAKVAGTGWVAVRNSNHYGIAGYYSLMAVQNDMIGWAMTNANPLVAPTFSIDRFLGTNPIAVAIPAGKQPAFVADFATTPIARGKIDIWDRKGLKAPAGFLQDSKGLPTDDPSILKKGGAMIPLGSDREHGSHKGYCLAAIVDIFSSVLGGANFGPYVPPSVAYLPVLDKKVGEGTGHFFGAMRIDAFRPAQEFKDKMDEWIETFRNARPSEGQERVLIPGDPERECEAIRRKEGIALHTSVEEDMRKIAEELGISFPEVM